MEHQGVRIWEEKILIPTYGVGKPEKNPMFFENRIYQGSSGAVYPNPIIEKIFDEKKDKEYVGLFLENQYIKILILPQLGGRVQMAYDKVKQRHFVYYNQVIKPALVGLCGPWISGGIEFNWPQHHRPSTFEAIDYTLKENKDGSKTIWVNEIEKMFGTKAMAGFTLYPDKAYLEINVKLFNRTPVPQTFLWWANPAVKVNNDYQSIFPPDVNAVFDHGKRDVSSFPIATGTYYKVNYAPGTDISRYKNIPVPTSYMAIHSDFDFLGGYEHDSAAGVLHVANHHVAPGKKQWTWGNGDFGKAWDKNLTDEDGPYIELMAGVFTDNQPDFSWLMPYEEKSFKQYFLPYSELGLVKNASKDVLVNVDVRDRQVAIKVFATSKMEVIIQLFNKEHHLYNTSVNIDPENVFTKVISVAHDCDEKNIRLEVLDHNHNELINYNPANINYETIPKAAKSTQLPELMETNEQLYFAGLHLEQYRHATYSPVSYYEEALRRNPLDTRCNNALGLWYFKRGQFVRSEGYFKKAIESITRHNSNPYDGEAYYNLGLCLKMQDKFEEAYKAFYKGAWNGAWQDACYFSLAQLDIYHGDFKKALEHIQLSINRNAGNGKSDVIKVAALRKIGLYEDALLAAQSRLENDAFNLGLYFELSKIYTVLNNKAACNEALYKLYTLAKSSQHNYFEYALDYADCGLFQDAIDFLLLLNQNHNMVSPLTWYYLGWFYYKLNNHNECKFYFNKAAKTDSAYCFPNKLYDIKVLELATNLNSSDAKAPYYLGNLWYDKRQYSEAISNWELSVKRDSNFPTAVRNLGIAYYNKLNSNEKAIHAFERAFELDPKDARVLMELDQLYKIINIKPNVRLSFLENNLKTLEQRDDLYLERIALYNFLDEFDKAYEFINARNFHPWEGGEGKVSGQYCYSLVELAKKQIFLGNPAEAIALLEKTHTYPDNIGEGKLFGIMENDVYYWQGLAYEQIADPIKANEYYCKATQGFLEPSLAIVYNDQQPDKLLYQGYALQKVGEGQKADQIFNNLIKYGITHLNDEMKLDYFAVSLPHLLIFNVDFNRKNRVHCNYMIGLGYMGLENFDEAEKYFNEGLDEDVMHFGCKTHLQLVARLRDKALA